PPPDIHTLSLHDALPILDAINAIINDPELGLDYSRMVHGDQRFHYTRPVHAGDKLRITTYVDEIFDRMGNDFLNLRAEITDESRSEEHTSELQSRENLVC